MCGDQVVFECLSSPGQQVVSEYLSAPAQGPGPAVGRTAAAFCRTIIEQGYIVHGAGRGHWRHQRKASTLPLWPWHTTREAHAVSLSRLQLWRVSFVGGQRLDELVYTKEERTSQFPTFEACLEHFLASAGANGAKPDVAGERVPLIRRCERIAAGV